MTDVTSEQKEGPEREEVNGRYIRSDTTALYIAEIRDVEDSMQCGEEMTEDTYTTMECQTLCKQLPEDKGTTKTTWDEQNKGDMHEKDSEVGEGSNATGRRGTDLDHIEKPQKNKENENGK